ncbi:MAG: methyltransferase domain-containing protein [Bacteroidetes bacterium]|nr:MAG: methyltransferase domain-containing protein [Bacteroidota bacterium]
MRIIAGKFGGRSILAPTSLPVRPTTDYAKSGLFNILNNHFDFENLKVLDLFCGTGNISFEFASRGTNDITCVDKHPGCVKFVSEFAGKIGALGIKTVKADVTKFIRQHEAQYDIIFADPPFELMDTDELTNLILQKQMLKENGWLIVEHMNKRKLKTDFEPAEVREYGNCAFSIYKNSSL